MRPTQFLFACLTLFLALTAPEARAQPTRKAYLETLLARTRGTLTNMKHRERNFVSWSRGRWQSLEDSQALIDWFDATTSGDSVSYRLRTARDQARKLIVFEDTADRTADEILAELATLEGTVFKHALAATFGERCATYDSTVDRRSIFLEPSKDSAQVGQVHKGAYVTLLGRDGDWARVRFWTGDREVKGYMEVASTFEAYAAPATPPKLLQKRTPKTVAAAKNHYLKLLEVTAQGALSNLRHSERSYAHSVREHWTGLATSEEQLAFFESNEDGVHYRLEVAFNQARLLSGLGVEQLASLVSEQAAVIRTALLRSASEQSATFDSTVDYRALRVAPEKGADLRTKVYKHQTFVLLESEDPEWIKVRWFDTDLPVEGYMERASTLQVLAAPQAQATTDAGLDSSFIDTLLNAQGGR
jgi:hypothetical protein